MVRRVWVLENHLVQKKNGKSACTAPSPFPATRWVSRKRIKVATTKFGSISFTSMLGWLTVRHGMTDLEN